MIALRKLDHIGIRVADGDRSTEFYKIFGFKPFFRNEEVVIVRDGAGLELNFLLSFNDDNAGRNILMDEPKRYAGYTHMALEVVSLEKTITALRDAGIEVTEGPVELGGVKTSVFIRDPDRNVVELTQYKNPKA